MIGSFIKHVWSHDWLAQYRIAIMASWIQGLDSIAEFEQMVDDHIQTLRYYITDGDLDLLYKFISL